ncbi:conserved hypothetical protein [candidate division TM7 genomosp. GTL1]|nr:conserved hypothetical protein [candidate division TM7 genomosp. GTL1]
MIDEKFVILGAFLNLIGSLSYVRDTLKGKTQPNRVSWFLWAAAPLIAFSAEINNGVGLPALMTFMVGFGPLMVFLASFVNRKSSWKLTHLDIICGVLSVVGLILWQVTGSGYVAIIFSILADGIAAVPTIVKSYRQPESESWLAFFFGAISAVITLFTIDTWDFAHYGFPIYIFIVCTLLVILIKFRVGTKRKLAVDAPVAGEDEKPLP